MSPVTDLADQLDARGALAQFHEMSFEFDTEGQAQVAHEIDVPGSLHRCIRVMLHWNTSKSQHDIQHVYLKEAQSLRPDKTVLLSSVDMDELNRWIEEQLAVWSGTR